MPYAPAELHEVAKRVAQGEQPQFTVRQLLSWFGYKSRHTWAVGAVRQALKGLNLVTRPDFDWTYLDGLLTFLDHDMAISIPPQVGQPQTPGVDVSRVAEADGQPTATREGSVVVDPTYRIGRLEIAHRPPTSARPDTSVREAITLMLRHDFSQLPVMTTEREAKGIFSWKSLASRESLGRNCCVVAEATDRAVEISTDATLFEAIALIRENDCVLVRDTDRRITGIITHYDISTTFAQLGEPFLVLGEIENHIRDLIEGSFTKEELTDARDPSDRSRAVESVSDLAFGEYLRLLQNPDRWKRLDLRIDRSTFVKDLEEIRTIRNEVMHFDPEGIEESELAKLRSFLAFLRRLQVARPRPQGQPQRTESNE